MKYCAYLVVTTILCCLSFVACSNEEEKFETLSLKLLALLYQSQVVHLIMQKLVLQEVL